MSLCIVAASCVVSLPVSLSPCNALQPSVVDGCCDLCRVEFKINGAHDQSWEEE